MYNIESTISFKLRDLKRISEVIEIAEKNKIELMGNIDYSVSNLKNEYLKKLITRAYIDSRLTIFFGDTLSDFENIVSDILPIETEKNPYREVIKQLEELVRIKNGDEE